MTSYSLINNVSDNVTVMSVTLNNMNDRRLHNVVAYTYFGRDFVGILCIINTYIFYCRSISGDFYKNSIKLLANGLCAVS